MGIKYINIKIRSPYCVDQTRPCSHTNRVCDTIFFLQSNFLHHRRLKMMLDDTI